MKCLCCKTTLWTPGRTYFWFLHFSPAILFPVVGSADQLEKIWCHVKKKKRNPTLFFHASSEVSWRCSRGIIGSCGGFQRHWLICADVIFQPFPTRSTEKWNFNWPSFLTPKRLPAWLVAASFCRRWCQRAPSKSPCLVVRHRLCLRRVCACAPSGVEQRVSQERDYSTQWGEAGLWQLWLKMEELALRVHAGKPAAVVTCAVAVVTFASITLAVEHRRTPEGWNIHERFRNFDIPLFALSPPHG